MFKRKLLALDFINPNDFNIKDETQFRNLIIWLEDQKIRHYKIEDRVALRNIVAGNWEDALRKYLDELGCPISPSEKMSMVDWLLGYAVRLEYGDNTDKYRNAASSVSAKADSKKSSNPLDNLDFNDADFKAGVVSLAQFLQIPPHDDHLVVLKAICLLVREKFSKEALERVQKEGIKKFESIPLEKIETGFETPDYISAEAAKILRLLHVRELRELQDSINQAIVAVQSLTANPKTDTKLGKIGRS